jgi:hypothetical protein
VTQIADNQRHFIVRLHRQPRPQIPDTGPRLAQVQQQFLSRGRSHRAEYRRLGRSSELGAAAHDVQIVATHFHTQKRSLACLFVVIIERKRPQSGIAQSNQVAFASLGCVNDALCNDFVNDCRLAPIMKLSAGIIERFAHQLGNSIIKDGSGLSDKRQNGRHVSFSWCCAYEFTPPNVLV